MDMGSSVQMITVTTMEKLQLTHYNYYWRINNKDTFETLIWNAASPEHVETKVQVHAVLFCLHFLWGVQSCVLHLLEISNFIRMKVLEDKYHFRIHNSLLNCIIDTKSYVSFLG